MPWMETSPVKERQKFVNEAKSGLFEIRTLCRAYGISAKTGYKWMKRYDEDGPAGLEDRSRSPDYCPHRVDAYVQKALLAMKRKHPTWGARKVRQAFINKGRKDMPAESTVNELFDRHGLVKRRRRRQKSPHPGKPYVDAQNPNDVWTADYKGEFKTKDGIYCYPLTVSDLSSRYLLACSGHLGTKHINAQPVFERLFRRHGLPKTILTDNGGPFWAPNAMLRLSRLSVWWITLGIEPVATELASPHQNGAHERMHRTLKNDATKPPGTNLKSQQRKFDRWRSVYNNDRPHEFHDGQTPSQHWEPSPRPFPKRIAGPEYPAHFEVRKVNGGSTFRFKSGTYFLTRALIDHHVGLEEVNDGIWDVFFYDVHLARFDERDKSQIHRF